METINNDLIDQLAQAIAKHTPPQVPLNYAIWDADRVAAYFNVSTKYLLGTLVPHPKFPKRIRLPAMEHKSRPRWIAQEIIKYALEHQEKR